MQIKLEEHVLGARIVFASLGTLPITEKSLIPFKTIRPASGFDQLYAPIVALGRSKHPRFA